MAPAVLREFSDFPQKVLKARERPTPCYDPAPKPWKTAMALPHVVYEFGEFHLDREERVLRRGQAAVSLTPKATDILLTLVGRGGRIVEKAELMQLVWPDTAVEESNLTQNIYTLRRILADGDGKCPFIETVPRRGYRFVAPVRTVHEAAEAAAGELAVAGGLPMLSEWPREAQPAEPQHSPVMPEIARASRRPWAWRPGAWLLLAGLGAAVIGTAALREISRRATPDRPARDLTAPVTRVTNLGNVVRAALSWDGRSVVYAVATGARESLWVNKLDSARSVQLVEPAVGTFRRGGGVSSAPDGWVYYTWFRPDLAWVGIFRIHQDGGPSEPVNQVKDLPSFDPSGRRFACISTTSITVRESRLLVYDAAGKSPRVVAVHVPPRTFLQMRPAWSPDGRQLAAWTMSEHEPSVRELVIVDVEGGRERTVARPQLHTVDGMVWLPDGSSVVVAARAAASAPLRLWQISVASGEMRPLTSDISDYLLAGLAGEGRQVAAVRVDVARSLWMAPVKDLSQARQVGYDAGDLSELESLAWMKDGRLLYTSTESGNADIWMYEPAKDSRRRLTTSPSDDFNPASAPHGKTIVFASDRSGGSALWAMSDAGESSVKQLTTGGDSRPSVSRDGTVVFQRGVIQSGPLELWRVPLKGGAATRLAEGVSIRPAVSPDGRMLAYYWLTPERWTLAVGPTDGGEPLRLFPLSSTHCGRTVRWSPDSRSLAYIDCNDGAANIRLQRLDGSAPETLTSFRSGHITTFDWSHDGSQLAWINRTQVSDVVLLDLPRESQRISASAREPRP
jgi:DNA-binding winged helix-turn-helix (wHTH) protein/Tol biopolymer transport system component